jgi:DNA-binding CsgD family transcriptional regulator
MGTMTRRTSVRTNRQRFATALQSALSLDEVGQAFLTNATAVLPADAFGLYRFGEGQLTPVEVLSDREYGFLEQYEDYGRQDDPVLEFAIRRRRPIDSSRAVPPDHWEKCGARAALGEAGLAHSLESPLVAAGDVIGTINFARRRQSAEFTPADLASARLIGEQLSLALERALRYEMLRRQVSMLERALDHVPHGVVVSDLENRIMFSNRMASRTADQPVRGLIADAITHFRDGKRVYANNIKNPASREHTIVKSWLEDEGGGTVVTLVDQVDHREGVRIPNLAALSPREQDIARLVGEGLTAREIAGRAFITEHTVKQHLKRIFAKTGVRNRAELVQLIWSAGAR